MVTLWKEQNLPGLTFWLPVLSADDEGANLDFFKVGDGAEPEKDEHFEPVAATSKLRSWLWRVLAVEQTNSTLFLSLVEADAKVMLIVRTKSERRVRKRYEISTWEP